MTCFFSSFLARKREVTLLSDRYNHLRPCVQNPVRSSVGRTVSGHKDLDRRRGFLALRDSE